MNQLSSALVLDVAGLGLATAVIIQILKGLVNIAIKPDNPNQNNIIRALVYLVAIGVVAFFLWTQYALNTRADILRVVTAGFTVGSFAIATYHLVTGDSPSLADTVLLPSMTDVPSRPVKEPADVPVIPVPEDVPAA